MSIRFQADNDLNRLIVAATFRREPTIDFQSAQTAQLDYLDDETVLQRAASEAYMRSCGGKACSPAAGAWIQRKISRPDNWKRLIVYPPAIRI